MLLNAESQNTLYHILSVTPSVVMLSAIMPNVVAPKTNNENESFFDRKRTVRRPTPSVTSVTSATSRAGCYKTFCVGNLQIFVIS
jgi:hypothetical protein